MLSMSKTSFKIKQHQDPGTRGPKSPDMSDKRNESCHALKCIPGEYIREEAAHVRKSIPSQDGEATYIPGTLYCTNLRVAFLPDPSPNTEDCSCQTFMHSDYDVALPCIGRLLAVNSFTKAKVLTSTSTLKFIPEELIICCRDFRVLRFRFHDSGLEPQAFRVSMAIAQAHESSTRDGSYEDAALKNLGNCRPNQEEEVLEEEEEKKEDGSPTLLFQTLRDWEKELQRIGATGWRVSPVNERFDMSTSLPKYLWVPSWFLDNELKRAFVHFNERRIPRLCWHHPGGSDLLRAASFHPDSDPEKEDMRSVETLMLAGHPQCVIVEVTADLPSPPEIQQSYSKLWNLSLCLADSFVSSSDEKWLSSLEGTRWLDHVRVCLKKASEVAVLLAERSRSVLLQESDDRDLNCLLASLVQVISDPHARTISGFQSLVQKEWVATGHPFLQRLNLLQKNDRDESPVFLLFLDCTWQLLQQFPGSFQFTEAYLVALHESSYVPFSNTFLFNCQWERGRRNQNRFLTPLYTPINGWREPLCLEILEKDGYPVKEATGASLPTIWDWSLRYSPRHMARFRNPCYRRSGNGGSNGGALNGNFLPQNIGKMENAPPGKRTLYLFSKGSLSLQAHFFPWKNGSLAKKGSRRSQGSEAPREQDRSRRCKTRSFLLHHDGLLLLPSYAGPSIRLWRRCYLRGSPETQAGLFAPSIVGLTEELDLLQERLNYWQARGS
ncbi:myotubularin-related protein 11 [Podarcis raffonei]|uniref:myotubularin-related protein 11 n=1 Tax=Podarcis raffonei TaxID=65483 RepID=UPI0023295AA8|nr:myotubularin-related protein 11 [Podarcis raffonei]